MSLSLNEINQALKPYRREAHQQLELEKQISTLRHHMASHRENLKYLDEALAKEWADVEALTKTKWRRFWLNLDNVRQLVLEKEQKEWEVVREERQNLVFLMAEVEAEIKTLQGRREYIGDVSAPLTKLLATKHQLLLASETHDIYQSMVAEEEELKQKVGDLDKLAQGFQLAINQLQKVEVLIQDRHYLGQKPAQVLHLIDTTCNLIYKLVPAANKLRIELDASFSINSLTTFEAQFNIASNADDWYVVLLDFENRCTQVLLQIQTQETVVAAQADQIQERRQKFLLESY
ncbi:MAG: hypothetical protein AAFN10_03955 [Bacteroidota bacterium]